MTIKESTPLESPVKSRRSVGEVLRVGAMQNVLLIGLIALIVGFQLATGVFLAPTNIRGILLDSAVLLIVAIPAALLLISGYVDLSVGSTLGLGGIATAFLLVNDSPISVAVLAGLLAAGLIGALNAFLITFVRLSPLIVTLGTLSLAFGLSRGISSLPLSGFPQEFRVLGGGMFWGVPIPVIISVVVALAGWFFSSQTPTGKHIYAIGSNQEAAYLSGLKVRTLPFALYVATALFAGFGGIINVSRLDSGTAGTLGVGFEITVLTALLLGGISFMGGSGSLVGVIIGVLFLGTLQNGLTLIGIPSFWQNIATGSVLILAAGLNYLNERRLKSVR